MKGDTHQKKNERKILTSKKKRPTNIFWTVLLAQRNQYTRKILPQKKIRNGTPHFVNQKRANSVRFAQNFEGSLAGLRRLQICLVQKSVKRNENRLKTLLIYDQLKICSRKSTGKMVTS